MEENLECDTVPSLTSVVENIFSSCDTDGTNKVAASTLMNYMKPLVSHETMILDTLQQALDPKAEDPLIDRDLFYEVFKKWAAQFNESGNISNHTFRESDNAIGLNLPFHQSTPKPSLSPSNNNIPNLFSLSNFSQSFGIVTKSNNNSTNFEKLEEKVKELEHKYLNTLSELSLVKSQLVLSEDQYAELRMDFDRTNKRLILEQQVNADLQKSMEHNDDFKEEYLSTKKEIDHLQKLLAMTKKENSNLIASIREMEFEKEQLDRKIGEFRKKEDQRKKELSELQNTFTLCEEENKTLKNYINDMKRQLDEQADSLKHYTEVSEILKNEKQMLLGVIRNVGNADSIKDPSNASSRSPGSSPRSQKYPMTENLEDLDMSIYSDNVSLKGQNLLSELQECKFLDNSNKCYIDDHREWLQIVREHEECSKTIDEYERKIELLAQDIDNVENEHKNLLKKYKNMENDAQDLRTNLTQTNVEKDSLEKKNMALTFEISNLQKAIDMKDEILGEIRDCSEKRNEMLEQQVKKIEEEVASLRNEKYAYLTQKELSAKEKEILQKALDDSKTEKESLIAHNSDLKRTNEDLTERLRIAASKKKDLEDELSKMKTEQDNNCREVEKLNEKLKDCNRMGREFVATIKKKLIDQTTKMEFLHELNRNLEKSVQELKNEMRNAKNELEEFIKRAKSRLNNGETDGSESNSSSSSKEMLLPRKGRRSNHEKMELRIERYREKIENLENDLTTERSKTNRISKLQIERDNLQTENDRLSAERDAVLEELEATRQDVSFKEKMLKESEENHAFQMRNLKEMHKKQKELLELSILEVKLGARETLTELTERMKGLQGRFERCEEEKRSLYATLDALEAEMGAMKEAFVSRRSVGAGRGNVAEETGSSWEMTEDLVLSTTDDSPLRLAENRIESLESLLHKCGMVLGETANDVVGAAKSVFISWRNIVKFSNEDILEVSLNAAGSNFHTELAENEIITINNNLILCSQLLHELAMYAERGTLIRTKSISKFTMRPPNLKFVRMPSSDPDISSSKAISSMRMLDSSEATPKKHDEIFNLEMVPQIEDTINSSVGSIVPLKENDSITRWLGQQSNNLRNTLTDRKITEKNFCHLSLTWKSNYENAKTKYTGNKRKCTNLRESYLRTLLKIVTCIKGHHCRQDQNGLIQALRLFENLKNIMSDVFKLAERYGASKQELRSMNCWNLIVDYVNGIHLENEKLRSFRCTSLQVNPNSTDDSLQFCDVTGQSNPVNSSWSEDSVAISEGKNALEARWKDPLKRVAVSRRPSLSVILLSLIFFVTLLIYVHLECIRNGNGAMVCPLDFFVSVKRGYYPH